jgi:hypothetical protein
MKNRLALILTILLVSALWSFAQVTPDPQPRRQPAPQPVQTAQPAQPPQPANVPPPPGDVLELRLDDANLKKAEYERAFRAQTIQNTFATYKQKTEKGSYIGLATSPIPAVLREQLKLPSGSGLVVDRVEPDSPAEAAGVKAYDVLQKLDEQVLINPHQFGVLVRTLKPGAEAKLAIIRETKPQTIAVTPVEKDLAPLDETLGYGPATGWRNAEPVKTTKFGGGDGQFTLTATPRKAGGGGVDFINTERAEMVTDNGTTIITTSVGPKGERRASVVEKATGKIIFDGAIDTEEQRQALPKEVQAQLKELDQMKLNAPMATVRAVRAPQAIYGVTTRLGGPRNNLPKPRSVSGSDDDYTWEFTTKTDETGKPELELLLLDKNGKILFQGPFSRTRDIPNLPGPVSERLGSHPWNMMIDDLKTAGGGALNVKMAPFPGAGAAPGVAPGGAGNNFGPDPKPRENRPGK